MKKYDYPYFVNNGLFFYEGQILYRYDCHNNLLGESKIVKFIKHYKREDKTPYICVSLQDLEVKSNKFTFRADTHLGVLYYNKIQTF